MKTEINRKRKIFWFTYERFQAGENTLNFLVTRLLLRQVSQAELYRDTHSRRKREKKKNNLTLASSDRRRRRIQHKKLSGCLCKVHDNPRYLSTLLLSPLSSLRSSFFHAFVLFFHFCFLRSFLSLCRAVVYVILLCF